MRVFLRTVLIVATVAAMAGCSKKEPSPVPAENPPADAVTQVEKTAEAITPAAVEPEGVEAKEVPAVTETVVVKEPTATKEIEVAVKEATDKPVEYMDSGIGMKAPALEGMSWIKGKPFKFESGKAYVVEFWATWCPPCRDSIPHLTDMQKHYKDKVTIIGVSNEDEGTIRPFVEKMGDKMDYVVARDAKGLAGKNYSNAFGQRGIPHAFIIDTKGRITWVGHPMDKMDQVLKLVIDGDFDPVAAAKQKAEQEALDKQLMQWYSQYFSTITTLGISDENTKIANMFIEKAHPEALNAMAWNILTLAEKDKRQLDIALKAAEKANTLTDKNSPAVLDTYALALFENGKIAEAIASQQKAVELAGANKQMLAELTEALEKYKAALETK